MELIIRAGKGDKQRIVFINTKIKNAIKELLKVRPNKGNYLFNTRQSEQISRSAVEKIFNKYSKIITPHQERHNYSSVRLARDGKGEYGEYSLSEIQYLLRSFKHSLNTSLLEPKFKRNERKSRNT